MSLRVCWTWWQETFLHGLWDVRVKLLLLLLSVLGQRFSIGILWPQSPWDLARDSRNNFHNNTKILFVFSLVLTICIVIIKKWQDETVGTLAQISGGPPEWTSSHCVLNTTCSEQNKTKGKPVSLTNVLDKAVKITKFINSWTMKRHIYNYLKKH